MRARNIAENALMLSQAQGSQDVAPRSKRCWLVGLTLLTACGGTPAADEDSESGSSDSSSESATTETGGEEAVCDAAAFEHAPPATTTVDGLSAVPIDIQDVDALMTFSFDGEVAIVDATITFDVSEAGGMPLFALRQDILVAELDGQTLDPALLARHDFGLGEELGFRVVERELEPCSTHTLRVGYALVHPQSGPVDAFRWSNSPPGLYFETKFQESFGPSLFIDAWLPANLPFDHHPLSVELVVEMAPAAHMVITNAELEALGEHQWLLEFGPETTSKSPFFAIMPAEEVNAVSGVHAAANGQDIPYTLYSNEAMSLGCLLESCESEVLSYVDQYALRYGPFWHPDLVAYLSDDVSNGHFDGVTTGSTINALLIGLFHSWWGTGLHPATYSDGWLEDGWALYSVQFLHSQDTFDWDTEPPVALVDPHPFARTRHADALNVGRRFFAGLAVIVGPQAIPETMAAIYQGAEPLGSLSTAELEQGFYCLNGEDPDIRRAFWRFVYGFEGEPEPPPSDYCD